MILVMQSSSIPCNTSAARCGKNSRFPRVLRLVPRQSFHREQLLKWEDALDRCDMIRFPRLPCAQPWSRFRRPRLRLALEIPALSTRRVTYSLHLHCRAASQPTCPIWSCCRLSYYFFFFCSCTVKAPNFGPHGNFGAFFFLQAP